MGERDPPPSSFLGSRRALLVAFVAAVVLLGARLAEWMSYRGGPPPEPEPPPAPSGSAAVAKPAKTPSRLVALTHVTALATDRHELFWSTEQGALQHTGKEDAVAPATLVEQPGVRVSSITVDDDNVYWSISGEEGKPGSVMRVPRRGGEPLKVADEPSGAPVALAVDGREVYWATPARKGDASDEGGDIKRTPGDGGAPVVLASGLATPCALAVDPANVFWVSGATGSVWRVAKAGGDPVNLSRGRNGALCAVALDATSVYWVDRVDQPGIESSTLRRVPKAGGEARIVAVEPHPVSSFAVDDAFAYYTVLPTGEPDPSEGGVWRVPTQHGGAPEYLARDEGSPSTIRLDASSLYWVGRGTGGDEGIWMLAK